MNKVTFDDTTKSSNQRHSKIQMMMKFALDMKLSNPFELL